MKFFLAKNVLFHKIIVSASDKLGSKVYLTYEPKLFNINYVAATVVQTALSLIY